MSPPASPICSADSPCGNARGRPVIVPSSNKHRILCNGKRRNSLVAVVVAALTTTLPGNAMESVAARYYLPSHVKRTTQFIVFFFILASFNISKKKKSLLFPTLAKQRIKIRIKKNKKPSLFYGHNISIFTK